MKVLVVIVCFMAPSMGYHEGRCKSIGNVDNGLYNEKPHLIYGIVREYYCDQPFVSNIPRLADIRFYCTFDGDQAKYVWQATSSKFQNGDKLFIDSVRCELKKECLKPPLPGHMVRTNTIHYEQAVVIRGEVVPSERFYSGDTIVYSCETGFEMESKESSLDVYSYGFDYYNEDDNKEQEAMTSLNLTCDKAGLWSGLNPYEIKYEECKAVVCNASRFLEVPNGNITNFKMVYGYNELMELGCNENFRPIGGITIARCETPSSFSQFTMPKFGCEPILCAEPPSPQNGRVRANGIQAGDTAQFYCNSGYSLIGSPVWICQSNGKWNATCTRCERTDSGSHCPAPCIPPGAEVISTEKIFLQGTVLEFVCKSGQYYAGDTNRTCLWNRKWSGTPIDCTGDSMFDPNTGSTLRNSLKAQVPWNETSENFPDDNRDFIAKSINKGQVGGVDVYLVIDVSKSIDDTKFNTTIAFVNSLLPELGISSDSRGTRLALYFFATRTKMAFNQHYQPENTLFRNYSEAATATQKYTKDRTNITSVTQSGTAITAALKDIKVDIETKLVKYQQGILRQAQQVIILLSDGRFTTDGNPAGIAEELKSDRFNVEIYSIAVGDRVNDKNGFKTMENIASNIEGENHYFPIEASGNYADILKQMIKETDYNLSCGQTKPHLTRIKDKEMQYEVESLENAWPFIAELRSGTEHKCGGSLIDTQWILTAAHCFPLENSIQQVHLKKWKKSQGEGHLVFHVRQADIRKHPLYDEKKKPKNLYDIALIKLQQKVEFDDTVLPVCLWNDELANSTRKNYSELFTSETFGVVTGWGESDSKTEILKQMQMPVKNDDVCLAGLTLNETAQVDMKLMFCAGGEVTIDGKVKQIDTCVGDSGGPFFVENPVKEDTYIQTGIVSFGFGCKQPDKYGFYTRLTEELLKWIQDTMSIG